MGVWAVNRQECDICRYYGYRYCNQTKAHFPDGVEPTVEPGLDEINIEFELVNDTKEDVTQMVHAQAGVDIAWCGLKTNQTGITSCNDWSKTTCKKCLEHEGSVKLP